MGRVVISDILLFSCIGAFFVGVAIATASMFG
jgi:hypothetical protein